MSNNLIWVTVGLDTCRSSRTGQLRPPASAARRRVRSPVSPEQTCGVRWVWNLVQKRYSKKNRGPQKNTAIPPHTNHQIKSLNYRKTYHDGSWMVAPAVQESRTHASPQKKVKKKQRQRKFYAFGPTFSWNIHLEPCTTVLGLWRLRHCCGPRVSSLYFVNTSWEFEDVLFFLS